MITHNIIFLNNNKYAQEIKQEAQLSLHCVPIGDLNLKVCDFITSDLWPEAGTWIRFQNYPFPNTP